MRSAIPVGDAGDITTRAADAGVMLVGVDELLRAWRDTLPTTAPPGTATRIGTELLTRWSEPQRHYHTVAHLTAVLTIVDEHAAEARDATAVRLAAWFHDAVYDPMRLDNEEASALLAEAYLPALGVNTLVVAEVARLIRLTATHDPMPGDRNGGLLTDADLAILAAAPASYRAYAVAIRREYAHVPDLTFVAGRAGVLRNLLSLPRLFHSPALRERWEEPARINLDWELTTLRENHLPYAAS